MTIVSVLLSTVFALLGAIHFYWAFGGKWGFANSLPTSEKGEMMLNPGKAASLIVGFGLLAFGVFYLMRADLIAVSFPGWVLRIGGWVIPVIFLFRAIGDFKYVGFFKKVRRTKFGEIDSSFYSPLCLGIAIAAFTVQILQ